MIVCYLSSDGNAVHDAVIRAFYEGISGDKELRPVGDYVPSEIAVVFGVGKRMVPRSFARGEIIAKQKSLGKEYIVLETGYINRGDGSEHHYAAGWNGLNGRADFRNLDMPGDRADKLRQANLLRDIPWRDKGNHVVLCGQVPWDASVDHTNHLQWLEETAAVLKKVRPVRFRPHPLAPIPPIQGCEYSQAGLAKDLLWAHAVVTFNSNSGVEATIDGVPVIACDEGSMVWNISSRLDEIEDPKKPERNGWLSNLAYAQWTQDEMRSGETWNHLTRVVMVEEGKWSTLSH